MRARNGKTPDPDQVEELSEFWDTHDLTDYEDELAEVKRGVFASAAPARVTVDLKPAEAAKAKRIAKARRTV